MGESDAVTMIEGAAALARVAGALVAPENVPMDDNNCRRADDADRHGLAEATLTIWSDLLAGR